MPKSEKALTETSSSVEWKSKRPPIHLVELVLRDVHPYQPPMTVPYLNLSHSPSPQPKSVECRSRISDARSWLPRIPIISFRRCDGYTSMLGIWISSKIISYSESANAALSQSSRTSNPSLAWSAVYPIRFKCCSATFVLIGLSSASYYQQISDLR